MEGLTLHTSLFIAMVKHAYSVFVPRSIVDLEPNPPEDAVKTDVNEVLGLEIASEDYEDKGISPFDRIVVAALHHATPLTDPNARWASPEDAAATLGAQFGQMLLPNVVWKDPLGDATLSRWVSQGLAAHMLEASHDGYVVDLSFMSKYAVRDGFQRYGAKLVLSPKLEPVAIDWHGERALPGSPGWEAAKLVFRSSVATAATIRDHAVRCHMLEANGATVAARRSLPGSHPIRRLLMPFQYRTPTINWDALLTLIGERAIFHRLFAFEWPALTEFYGDCKNSHRMATFPDELARRGVADLEGFAYAADGLDYWREVHAFVEAYVELYYGKGACPDDDLVRFGNDFAKLVPTALPLRDKRDLVELCAAIIFNATGFHEQVGGAIADNVSHLGLGAPNVRVGRHLEEMFPSKNTMAQAYMLGALTNFGMPGLLEDFSHLMLDDEARALVADFGARLAALSARIDERNQGREQAMVTFDPKHLEVSVAI